MTANPNGKRREASGGRQREWRRAIILIILAVIMVLAAVVAVLWTRWVQRPDLPGGDPAAWPVVKDLLEDLSARAPDGMPCCRWMGPEGAGHFVKALLLRFIPKGFVHHVMFFIFIVLSHA